MNNASTPFGRASLWWLLLSVLGTACAGPTVMIRVREAARTNIGPVERVAVPALQSHTQDQSGELVAAALRQAIAEQGAYRIVEAGPDQLRKLAQAVETSLSAFASEATAIQPGLIEVAQAFVFGAVSQFDAKQWQSKKTASRQVEVGQQPVYGYDAWGNPVITGYQPVYGTEQYEITETHDMAAVTVSFRVVDAASQRILAEKTYSDQQSKTVTDDPTNPWAGLFSTLFAPADNCYEMRDKLLKSFVNDFVQLISPHYVEKEKRLMTGEDTSVGLGCDLAEEGQLEAGARLWQNVMERKPEAAAANNLAIYYESIERPEQARQLYEQAIDLDPSAEEPRLNLSSLSTYVLSQPTPVP
ncbi:MAG: CsgG/HfaB family protein [Planctomycetota bacterium]